MKILIQWATSTGKDWTEYDSREWNKLPTKPVPTGGEWIDNEPGWINQINVQGVVFSGNDHYAVERINNGGIRVTVWVDDEEDIASGASIDKMAEVWTFYPLRPDKKMGNAINTVQEKVWYGTKKVRDELWADIVDVDIRPWEEFTTPDTKFVKHGIWLPDDVFAQHIEAASMVTWRDKPWTDHLPAQELGANGKLLSQRHQGRYAPSEHTRTYYQTNTAEAHGLFSSAREYRAQLTNPGGSVSAGTESPAAGATVTYGVWSTVAGEPDILSWPAGTYRVSLDVSTSSNAAARCFLRRDNSTLATNLADIDMGEQTGTGIKIYSVTNPAVNPGGSAQTDRYVIHVQLRGTHSMNAGSYAHLVNDADTFSDNPFPDPPPIFASGNAMDSGRLFADQAGGPYQDITITYNNGPVSDAALTVGGTATGHTIKINGVAQTTTYRGGSGTSTWTFRVPVLVKNGNTISYSYSQATGNTLRTADSVELRDETDQTVTNSLSKKVHFKLMGSDGSAQASQTVKYAIQQYDSATPANANWLAREQKGTATTTSEGIFDISYTGAAAVGANVYVTIIRPDTTPTESFVWHDVVQ